MYYAWFLAEPIRCDSGAECDLRGRSPAGRSIAMEMVRECILTQEQVQELVQKELYLYAEAREGYQNRVIDRAAPRRVNQDVMWPSVVEEDE